MNKFFIILLMEKPFILAITSDSKNKRKNYMIE